MREIRKVGRLWRTLVVVAVAGAVFGIASVVQADIPDSGIIHGCYGKPGTPQKGQLRVRDASIGEHCRYYENPLDWNQTGPTGPTGPTGFVAVGGWAGSPGTIPSGSGLVFAGPVTTQTITATQSIVASGSVALGTSNEGSAFVRLGVCVAPHGTSTLKYLDPAPGLAYNSANVTTNREIYGESQVGAPGAGTWDVGICANNFGPSAVDNNDWSIGYAFVSNGLPTSEAPAKIAGH